MQEFDIDLENSSYYDLKLKLSSYLQQHKRLNKPLRAELEVKWVNTYNLANSLVKCEILNVTPHHLSVRLMSVKYLAKGHKYYDQEIDCDKRKMMWQNISSKFLQPVKIDKRRISKNGNYLFNKALQNMYDKQYSQFEQDTVIKHNSVNSSCLSSSHIKSLPEVTQKVFNECLSNNLNEKLDTDFNVTTFIGIPTIRKMKLYLA